MTLEGAIRRIETFEEFEKQFSDAFLADDKRLNHYLSDLVFKYNVTLTEASGAAGCHDSYLGLLINGKKTNPTRDVLISLCLAIGATVDEAQQLLKYAGYAPLYVRRKRDVVIWFAFMKKLIPEKVDDLLKKRKYEPLTGDAKKERKQVIDAHKHSFNNYETLKTADSCGCFNCIKMFKPKQITDWIVGTDGSKTAVCPHCEIDAVIGDTSGYPINSHFLEQMREYWF